MLNPIYFSNNFSTATNKMEDQDVYENVDGLAERRQSDGSDNIYDIPHEPDYRESRGAGIQMERYVKINKSEQQGKGFVNYVSCVLYYS